MSALFDRHRAASNLIRVEAGAFSSRLLAAAAQPGVRSRVLGVLRWQRLLDEVLKKRCNRPLHKLDDEVRVVLRLALFEACLLGIPRAVATDALQLPPDVVAALNAERKYRAAMKHWGSYQAWKSHRNPARAELERKHGYDTKHAMHLIRLMRMGLEALQTGDLRVRRDDADELSAIRDGALSFDELLASATALQESMETAAATTRLPGDIDHDGVDALFAGLLRLP